jgi:hypothetical protein
MRVNQIALVRATVANFSAGKPTKSRLARDQFDGLLAIQVYRIKGDSQVYGIFARMLLNALHGQKSHVGYQKVMGEVQVELPGNFPQYGIAKAFVLQTLAHHKSPKAPTRIILQKHLDRVVDSSLNHAY